MVSLCAVSSDFNPIVQSELPTLLRARDVFWGRLKSAYFSLRKKLMHNQNSTEVYSNLLHHATNFY